MSRFNKPNTIVNRTVNLAGGEAFQESPKLEFISMLLTSFVKDQYYRTADEGLTRLQELMGAIPDKTFLAKGAIYARTKFGMRSISHAVAGEIALSVKGQEWTKRFFDKIIYRPDDMTEILSYYYARNGAGKEPNALKKGFAQAFGRFDEYQLGKYKKEGKEVSLIDVANLVHPTHSDAISKLIKGTLKTPETWEAKLSEAGQKAGTDEEKETLKADAWKNLVKERKIGYFALLRNLRNIIEQAPDLIPDALVLLTDEKLIRGSLVLPFRYLTAIEEIQKLNGQGVREVLGSLNLALDIAVANVPKFEGNTLVVLDCSGSMDGQPKEIGSLFSAILYKSNNADFMHFGSGADYVNFNPNDSVLTLAQQMGNFDDGGTNFPAIFETANKPYNRIIILSDMQGWMGYSAPTGDFDQYKRRVGGKPRIYSFDLAGEGTMQFPEENVFAIAGFSEKIFDVMKLLEQDRQALIHEIEKVEL